REDWNSLWKYTYLTGNGADTNGVWTNLSMNIPNNGTTDFDNFNSQGGYNLTIKVMPSNPDVIIIGGTNLYRSTDGFTSMNNTTQIGGYYVGSWSPGHWGSYLNHHPDQHELIFLPSDNNVLLSASDGGIARTNQVLDSVVEWISLNHGYLTTQLYTVGVDPSSTNDLMVAGFQDNGNYFVNSPDTQADWVMPLNGDGSYMGITNGADYFYLSIQMGRIYKMQLDSAGAVLGFGRIDPIGPLKSDYLFINPLALDRNNNDIMYVGAGNNLWRNDQLSNIPMAGNYDTIGQGWFTYSDSISSQSKKISAIAISKSPANIVWYGTTSRYFYKIVDAHTGDPLHEQMPIIGFPPANVSSIAIAPDNADVVMIAFSNYSVYSIFYTLDGGDNWVKGAGNLEESTNGSGSGPSIRSVAILPVGQDRLYFAGTSIGLFVTHQLDSLNTEWHQIGGDDFGNVVVEMVYTRETDGLVIAATHGKGIYTTHITSIEQVIPLSENEISTNKIDFRVYPNPIIDRATIDISLNYPDDLKISVFDLSGRIVRKIEENHVESGSHSFEIDISELKSGTYVLKIEGKNIVATKKIMKS
ncbi:MAG: T9SS type A sorting domain-containing protein, partial [Bacteroidota bacterium]|nr:T9SS type A sorting domain-containing protein [Bacteroidota bacterium]